jgi:hypothetical protein
MKASGSGRRPNIGNSTELDLCIHFVTERFFRFVTVRLFASDVVNNEYGPTYPAKSALIDHHQVAHK